MTKPLNTQLSQHDGATPRTGSRTRTWLVALLGFGAADLLVLNLWAVPNLITITTTTDMRAAQSGNARSAPSEPPPLAAAPAAVAEPAEPAEPAQRKAAQPAAEAAHPNAEPPAEAQQQLAAANPELVAATKEPEPHAAKPEATPAPVPPPPRAPALAAAQPQAANPTDEPPAQPEAATPNTEPPPAARAHAQSRRSRDAEPAQPRLTAVASDSDTPTDPRSGALFAIRAAQRAVQLALHERAGVSTLGQFDSLTTDDRPLTQIYFSLGNFSLGPNGKQVLERMLPQFASDERAILVIGAADPSGGEQINEKLSDARAQSVAEWLLAHGIDAERIQTRGIGHEGAVGSSLDRRVDIWLGGSR